MLIKYLEWHFFDVPRAILKAWKNFLAFNLKYFSMGLLLRTLFSPWRRYRSSYGRGLDLKRYFETFTFNMITRLIGAVMRSFLIVIGLLIEVLFFLAGIVILIGWLALPALLIVGLCLGLILI